MATNLSEFYPHVSVWAPGAPDPLLDTVIRNACIEFCRATLWLQEDFDPIPVQAGINPYEIDVPQNTTLAKVLAVYFDGNRLTPATESALTNGSLLNWEAQSGTPTHYTMFTPNEVTLIYTPDTAGTLTGRMALAPTRSAMSVDDTLYNEYQEEISHGAIARLKSIPGQPFSDPEGALASAAIFKYGIGKARIRATSGRMQAPMSVQMRTRT